jgi:hypothetical protein
MTFGGNIARTFTVMTEISGDILMIVSNIIPILINGYIFVQFLMYWNNRIEPTGETIPGKTPSVSKQSSKQLSKQSSKSKAQ